MVGSEEERWSQENCYRALAAAFARWRLDLPKATDDGSAIRSAMESDLRLPSFKRSLLLPRVRKILGVLRGVNPANLLDVGSGRGAFLWPLLDAFPRLPVTSIDLSPRRARNIAAVGHGGIEGLCAVNADAASMPFADNAFDVVTLLEVLEHIPAAYLAAAEALRVARRFVLVSVPSREDQNPEHIHLFNQDSMVEMFEIAGVSRIQISHVLNHLLAVVRVT